VKSAVAVSVHNTAVSAVVGYSQIELKNRMEEDVKGEEGRIRHGYVK
jgi:hypothetical protein